MANKDLQRAKAAKNDEFYTQIGDIQEELNHYIGKHGGKNHFKYRYNGTFGKVD